MFFSNQGETICQTARGLEECFGGKILDPQKGIDVQFIPLNSEKLQNPTTMTWLHSQIVSLVNELSTSSNYQNTIINTITMDSIRHCRCSAHLPGLHIGRILTWPGSTRIIVEDATNRLPDPP